MRTSIGSTVLSSLLLACGGAEPAPASDADSGGASVESVTWHQDVAPVIVENCAA